MTGSEPIRSWVSDSCIPILNCYNVIAQFKTWPTVNGYSSSTKLRHHSFPEGCSSKPFSLYFIFFDRPPLFVVFYMSCMPKAKNAFLLFVVTTSFHYMWLSMSICLSVKVILNLFSNEKAQTVLWHIGDIFLLANVWFSLVNLNHVACS